MSYVVTLTGGKNNSGDFLIKKKAHTLFQKLRPDLEILDIDGWLVDRKDLDAINNSVALILTGGPALIPNMVPAVYHIGEILDEIKVPIVTFGIGWFHANGDWGDISSFKFNSDTKKLFDRLANNGCYNSTRDYFTRELLVSNGVKNVMMTGCPVVYNGGDLPKDILYKKEGTVAISIGVGFKDSGKLFQQTKELILGSKERFKQVEVVFHHSLSPHKYVAKSLTKKQNELLSFLKDNEVEYIDASGSADNLMAAYDKFDIHFGYRVHAHLYMLSQGKLSYLIAEDGRGTGQQQVMGEPSFRSYKYSMNSKLLRGLHRLGLAVPSKTIDTEFPTKFLNFVENDLHEKSPKGACSIYHIATHYNTMKKYLSMISR